MVPSRQVVLVPIIPHLCFPALSMQLILICTVQLFVTDLFTAGLLPECVQLKGVRIFSVLNGLFMTYATMNKDQY